MSDTPEPTERLNYFTNQFLQAKDFLDEQTYHLRRRRWHNQYLHTWGVAYGLTLSATNAGDNEVTVDPGGAIDGKGQEIILPSNKQTSGLSNFKGQSPVYVTITYNEQQSDRQDPALTGASTANDNYTRWLEEPSIGLTAVKPDDGGRTLIVGKVSVDSSGRVASKPDLSADTYADVTHAGVVSGAIETPSLTIMNSSVNDTLWPSLTLDATSKVTSFSGPLQITGDLTATGDVGVNGGYAPASAEQGLRIVRCTVKITDKTAGNQQQVIPASTGIKATWTKSGSVNITLNSPFSGQPSFFVTPISSSAIMATVNNPLASGCTVLTWVSDQNPMDSDFALLIVGP